MRPSVQQWLALVLAPILLCGQFSACDDATTNIGSAGADGGPDSTTVDAMTDGTPRDDGSSGEWDAAHDAHSNVEIDAARHKCHTLG